MGSARHADSRRRVLTYKAEATFTRNYPDIVPLERDTASQRPDCFVGGSTKALFYARRQSGRNGIENLKVLTPRFRGLLVRLSAEPRNQQG